MIPDDRLSEALGGVVVTQQHRDLRDRELEWVERQTGRHFRAVENVTWYLRGSGTRRLWLPEVPKKADGTAAVVTDLTVVYRLYPGATDTALTDSADDGFVLREEDGSAFLIRKGGYVWSSSYEFQVTAKQGYATGSLPPDIEGLVLRRAARRWLDLGAENVRSETIGPYSYTRADAVGVPVVDDDERTLREWRGEVFA